MATRITLVRHGETSWNALGKWQGHAHVPLNDEGRRQAARLAEHLAATDSDFTAIYSSDSVRAYETAQIIAERLGKTVVPDVRLREIDMGEWQGLTHDEVRAWDAERYAIVFSDPVNIARPGGESSLQVAVRAISALEEIAERHRDGHVLAVTHGGTIVNTLRELGLWRDEVGHIGNTSLSRLLHNATNDNRWSLDAINLLVHLDAERAQSEQDV